LEVLIHVYALKIIYGPTSLCC